MLVDPNYVSNLSQAISASAAAEQKLTSQLSSGLRVATLSDDSVAVSTNALLSSSIAALDSFVHSSTGVQGRLQATDSTLGEVVSQVTSAISLAVQGANGTLNRANLSALANQASGIRDSIVSLANTSYAGSYLFSGSQGHTQPFTIDASTSPAAVTYAGDSVTSSVQAPGGQLLAVNLPGIAVFTAVFASLNQLVSDLQNGSASAVSADSSALTAALNTISLKRSTLDSSLNQLTSASGYAQTQESLLQAQQSILLSADPASVATSLKTAEVQHQALLSVVAALSQTNLFSYLK